MLSDAPSSTRSWSQSEMEARLVRYEELRPCFNAFIDTRTPGSETKENFTIIGPGVSENPDQFVHIAEPHGFNIGAARQPPACVNSQHSHDTAEVFVVHSGHWRFDLGETGEDAQIDLAPGDVISIPTRIFRGFTNIGDDIGTLWAILGEDNPGRVTWAPQVFELAQDYGLVLLESGRLIDLTKGEIVPEGMKPMAPTTADDVARMMRVSPNKAGAFGWKASGDESAETLLIGDGAHFGWPHGFTLVRYAPADGSNAAFDDDDPKVVFVHDGAFTLRWAGGELALGKGDTISVPAGLPHMLHGAADASVSFIVRNVAP